MSDKNQTDYNNPKSSLADIILVIAKHLILILILTFVSVIIAAIYVNMNYIPKYVSTTKLFIPDEGGGRYELGRIASRLGLQTQGTMGFDLGSSSLYPDIVNSRTFGKIMLDKEFYTKKYGKKLPLIAIFTYGDHPAPSNIDTLRISAANRIPNMVKFRMEMGFFIFDVTTNDPQFSKDFADTLLIELDKFQRKFKKHTTNETIVYIEQKIAYAKLELENSEEKLKYFRERNRDINNSPSLLLTHERLQRDVEIQKGIFLTLKQQLELKKIEEIQKGSFVQILDYPSLPIIASNPKKRSTYIIGGFIGFFFAIGLSFIIEYFRNNNKSEASKLYEAKKHVFESLKRIFTFNWFRNKNK
ncbi:MAG: hypothetical protein MUP82_07010 [Candidatus Marinimicrobia bacterium]|nr:hypothetical protein [Candidatus Neomarinimicrobiota bacterium]